MNKITYKFYVEFIRERSTYLVDAYSITEAFGRLAKHLMSIGKFYRVEKVEKY